ncbi:uncharacterized protein TM35_000061930 [Trypanosoma theileri]|uniref:Uncharacterized protein n=1 Tax=Trypanosoma theileri TaxID=67003 RepID=A0A1X0P2Z7_9TRYP|nr:uncharacterized protein TM35_000061930 [Trypanosoma theileri]ORC91188.1 hypothetical protein TM35_000061930 [Trypanosoma theileri]
MRSSTNQKGNRTVFLPRATMCSLSIANAGGKEMQSLPLVPHCAEVAPMPELNLDETLRIRSVFFDHIHDEYINNTFDLRVVLAELGLYPSEEELQLLLDTYEHKVNVTHLCNYLRFYKREYQLTERARRSGARDGGGGFFSPEEREDTLRAFVALGGREGGGGAVALADLRRVCRAFGLAVDVDAMARDAGGDAEGRGAVDFAAFTALWRPPGDGSGSNYSGSAERRPSRSDTTTTAYDRAIAAGARRRSATREFPENYKFPQISGASVHTAVPPNSSIMNINNGGNNNINSSYNPLSEEEHLQALRQYLCPEKCGSGHDASSVNAANSSGINGSPSNIRRKPGRNVSIQQSLYTIPQGEVERHRSIVGTREEAGGLAAAAGSGGADEDGTLPATAGGFRAPSPMILSLRNSAIYKRRLMTFTQRNKTKPKTSRSPSGWTRSASVVPDDDLGRS